MLHRISLPTAGKWRSGIEAQFFHVQISGSFARFRGARTVRSAARCLTLRHRPGDRDRLFKPKESMSWDWHIYIHQGWLISGVNMWVNEICQSHWKCCVPTEA